MEKGRNVPLKYGSDQQTIAGNIAEMIKKYHKTGHIGSSKKLTKEQARKRASAIAYSKAREGN